jgi:hypothetical protein
MKDGESCSRLTKSLRILSGFTLVIGAVTVITMDTWISDAQARGFRAYGRGAYVRPYRPIDTVGRYQPFEHPAAVGYAAGQRAAYNTAAAVLPYLPNNCSIEDDNGTVYNCNGLYYRPYYQGTEVNYRLVNPPSN